MSENDNQARPLLCKITNKKHTKQYIGLPAYYSNSIPKPRIVMNYWTVNCELGITFRLRNNY